jgi:hypothetical protein
VQKPIEPVFRLVELVFKKLVELVFKLVELIFKLVELVFRKLNRTLGKSEWEIKVIFPRAFMIQINVFLEDFEEVWTELIAVTYLNFADPS